MAVVERFYDALSRRDGDAMAACYDPEVVFEDPAFGELHGADAGDMWRMLCARSSDLRIDYTILEVVGDVPRQITDRTTNETADHGADEVSDHAQGSVVRTNWVAHYSFGSSGRPVRNDITATMRIRDSLIVDHRDSFDLWKWSSQALGLPGRIFGWSPLFHRRVRATAIGGLRRYQSTGPR